MPSCRRVHRLILAATLALGAVTPSPPAAAVRNPLSAARRASDRMHRVHRYERTLDPTMRRGRQIQVANASSAVTFAPPPAIDPTAPAPSRPYDHVLIISIDGLRPDAFDVTDAPNLRMLRAQGANSLEARTITHSYTLPSHTSMLSGVDTDRHGLLHNNFTPSRGFSRVPPIFYYAHDAGLTTAMFVSKPKLRHIAIPGSVDVFARPDYACGPVVAAAAEHLSHTGAGLTFVHLSEPDEYGHSRGWMTEAYLRGVATADQCIGTLLTTIARRPDLDRFLMVISADHGGHGRTHGSERDVDMRIPWIAWGSRVVRGAFSTPVSTMDTAATALAALGLPVPAEFTGRTVRVAFDAAAVAAPAPAVPDASPIPAAAPPETTPATPGDGPVAATTNTPVAPASTAPAPGPGPTAEQ